jgi:hypothetical protein
MRRKWFDLLLGGGLLFRKRIYYMYFVGGLLLWLLGFVGRWTGGFTNELGWKKRYKVW